MTTSDRFLGDRERALEEAFFAQRNAELLDKLRSQLEQDALSQACGISSSEALRHLLAANIKPETVAALALIPLVSVAWADGKMQDTERQAILEAARGEGIYEGSICHELLESWLVECPGPDLVEGWKGYVEAVAPTLSPAALDAFREDVLGRAKNVARAAGGLLGLGAISEQERGVLDALASAFPE